MVEYEELYEQFHLSRKEYDKLFSHFNQIKDKVKLVAKIDKHYLKNKYLCVKMKVTIDQFYQYLLSEKLPWDIVSSHRKLWYMFIDYVKNIFEYNYCFDNIKQINRFLPETDDNFALYPADYAIKDLPYNICSSAQVTDIIIDENKDFFTFIITAEGYDLDDTDFDKKVKNRKFIFIDNKELVKEEEIEEDDETKEEEMNRLISEYKDTGVAHAHIAYELIKRKQEEMSNVEFIRQMGLTPKVIKHIQNDKTISIECVITKRQLLYDFSVFRSLEDNKNVWDEFKDDFYQNYNKYLLNKKDLNVYISKLNMININYEKEIYNINVKPNSIKFWSDIII